MENSFKPNEELFRKAIDMNPDAININRLSDGLYISVNDGFTKITGFTEDDVIGKTSLELNIWCNPGDRVRLNSEIKNTGKIENFEAEFRKKDGSIINGLMSVAIIEIDGILHNLSITRDITERKKIYSQLINEQFLVNALMENLTDHVYFKDTESRFIRINQSMLVFLGLNDPSQAIGKTDFDFFSDEHARKAFNDEMEIIKSGRTINTIEKETYPDKPDTWVSTVKMPLHDKDGVIIGTFGISRNITTQKYAEETLKESEARFRSVAQSAHDAIVTIDYYGNILGWNRGAEKIFGFEESEILGESLNILIPEDYLKQHIKAIILSDRRRGDNSPDKIIEAVGLRKGGSSFPLELSLAEWETGEGRFFTGIIRDVTERKKTDMNTQVMYEITQGITTSSNLDELLSLVHKSLGKVFYSENFFIALYDYNTSLFSFPYFVDKFDEPPLPTSMGKSCTSYVLRTSKPFLFTNEEFEILLQNNEVEVVGSPSPSWVGIPLQTPSKVIGVMVLQHYEQSFVYNESDVRVLMSIGSQVALAIERKQAETEIIQKNEQLLILNNEKDKFFSIIAHDLRGPLSTFVAATQVLVESDMTLDDVREITLSMKRSATNLYGLLENLLEWSQLKRGVIDFHPQKFNLAKKVADSIKVLYETSVRKNINIEISIPDNIYVYVDNHMFDTVIRNMVSNSLKFTPSGGRINLTSNFSNDKSVELKISDTGIGMTPELMNKIFELNANSGRIGTEGEPSTGLGLLLCKEFIHKHGGEIRVESEVGVGTIFTFSIPGRKDQTT